MQRCEATVQHVSSKSENIYHRYRTRLKNIDNKLTNTCSGRDVVQIVAIILPNDIQAWQAQVKVLINSTC